MYCIVLCCSLLKDVVQFEETCQEETLYVLYEPVWIICDIFAYYNFCANINICDTYMKP